MWCCNYNNCGGGIIKTFQSNSPKNGEEVSNNVTVSPDDTLDTVSNTSNFSEIIRSEHTFSGDVGVSGQRDDIYSTHTFDSVEMTGYRNDTVTTYYENPVITEDTETWVINGSDVSNVVEIEYSFPPVTVENVPKINVEPKNLSIPSVDDLISSDVSITDTITPQILDLNQEIREYIKKHFPGSKGYVWNSVKQLNIPTGISHNTRIKLQRLDDLIAKRNVLIEQLETKIKSGEIILQKQNHEYQNADQKSQSSNKKQLQKKNIENISIMKKSMRKLLQQQFS